MRLTPLLVTQQMSKQFSRITALPEKAFLIGKECLTNSQIVPHKNPNGSVEPQTDRKAKPESHCWGRILPPARLSEEFKTNSKSSFICSSDRDV